jgi:UDP-N-acetylglucosamine diphosphorylase/glucosamine-1-phosphate N-acetyltransferase
MKSPKAKVLHAVCGKPMILYVVDTARQVAGDNVILVVGHQAEEVRALVARQAPAFFAHQARQRGTGHAVKCALPAIPANCRQVVVLCGDVPLLSPSTLSAFVDVHCDNHRALSLMAVHLDNPKGYGRLLCNADGNLEAIVEEADATDLQRSIKLVNAGIYCVESNFLKTALSAIDANNAQGEFYLTDIVAVAHRAGQTIGVTIGPDPHEFIGVNSPDDLEAVERILTRRRTK